MVQASKELQLENKEGTMNRLRAGVGAMETGPHSVGNVDLTKAAVSQMLTFDPLNKEWLWSET